MSIKNLFQAEINTEDYIDFKRSMVIHNLQRSKILAVIVIVLELILSAIDVVTSMLKVDESFHFNLYLFMYMIMILANILILAFAKKVGGYGDGDGDIVIGGGHHDDDSGGGGINVGFGGGGEHSEDRIGNPLETSSPSRIRKIEYCLMAYMIFMLTWGSVVTLMDQQLYGQAMTFVIDIIICSGLYYFESREMLAIYIVPVLLLYLGLPFFQSSTNILIGHYVNISILIVLSFAASRVSFSSFLANFKSNKLLSNVNLELKELTLVDDLTQIPNRRNFNAYIDFKYKYTSKEDTLVSVIMIDIDCFKQYNDNYGHLAGDEIIIAVAQQIHSIVRHSQDFVARIGGDEFVFISESTSEEGILKIANRIIDGIASLKIPHMHSDVSQYVTLSLGTATTKLRHKEDIYKCLENADKALYKAKKNGRNGAASYNLTHPVEIHTAN